MVSDYTFIKRKIGQLLKRKDVIEERIIYYEKELALVMKNHSTKWDSASAQRKRKLRK